MNKILNHNHKSPWAVVFAGILAVVTMPVLAQTSHEVVDEGYEDTASAQAQVYAPLTSDELEELAGPIALYPDDLVSLILPASTYPVQIVQAARYLENRERDNSLQPPDDWDDAVVALLNYPEVIELMNDDLDWTWALGEAFLNQQAGLLDAVSGFRGQAYAAGNLKSDERQIVTVDHEVIEIAPADPEVIYVPYYEPARVIVYQPYPVYYYHRYPRYAYYYPYPADYSFAFGYFFGVSTAYRLHWNSHRLYTYHYGYRGHPYYGRSYFSRHYFRHQPFRHYRPRQAFSRGGYAGDVWKPRPRHGSRPRDGIRTPRSSSRFTNAGRAAGLRNLTNPAQRYRDRNKRSTRSGYVSPYKATNAARPERQARSRNTHAEKQRGDRQATEQQRSKRLTPVQAERTSRAAIAKSPQRARAYTPDRSNHTTRPEGDRIRSSRPAAQATRASGVSQANASRVRTSRPAAQKRQAVSRPLAYSQQQRPTATRPTQAGSRNVVVNRRPARAAQPAPQRRTEAAPQRSRPAKAAPTRQARQPEARPARAPSRSEKPRATGRKAPRRH